MPKAVAPSPCWLPAEHLLQRHRNPGHSRSSSLQPAQRTIAHPLIITRQILIAPTKLSRFQKFCDNSSQGNAKAVGSPEYAALRSQALKLIVEISGDIHWQLPHNKAACSLFGGRRRCGIGTCNIGMQAAQCAHRVITRTTAIIEALRLAAAPLSRSFAAAAASMLFGASQPSAGHHVHAAADRQHRHDHATAAAHAACACAQTLAAAPTSAPSAALSALHLSQKQGPTRLRHTAASCKLKLSSQMLLRQTAASQLRLFSTAATAATVRTASAGAAGPAASSERNHSAAAASKGHDSDVQNTKEPVWRRPSEPPRAWDQPEDRRRLVVFYSDQYRVVSPRLRGADATCIDLHTHTLWQSQLGVEHLATSHMPCHLETSALETSCLCLSGVGDGPCRIKHASHLVPQELPEGHRYPMTKYQLAHQQLRGDAALHGAINFQPVSRPNAVAVPAEFY